LLLEAGADINKADNNGWTPLCIAAQNGNVEIVKLLLDSGANVNKATKDGLTALSLAANYGHETCVKLLLDATYNDIADKVLVAMSQQYIIFDTEFIIFKKTVEEAITIEGFNIDDPDTHKKLYNIFKSKISK
jgi:ankyrin repeat protein